MQDGLILPDIVPIDFENKWLECSTDEYHAMKNAVHSSSLSSILKSPHAYKHYLMNKRIATKAMNFGRVAHEAILEGSKFLSRYIVEPKFEGLTQDGKMSSQSKAAKQAKQEWHDSLDAGVQVVTQDELDKLRWMIDSITSHPIASKVLSDGVSEAKGTWRDPATGLLCVMQADFFSQTMGLVEVKTTTSCEMHDFMNAIQNYKYYLQIMFYAEGIAQITGKAPSNISWVAVESQAPYECRIYEIGPIYEDIGKYWVKKCLLKIKNCIDTGEFAQAQNVIEDAMPPKYLVDQYNELTQGIL